MAFNDRENRCGTRTSYRLAPGHRTKSELSLRDVERALANARYNMNIAMGATGGEPDVNGVSMKDDNHVMYNSDGSVDQNRRALRMIRFEPCAEQEQQDVLEDKSISMIATPAHSTIMSTRAQPVSINTNVYLLVRNIVYIIVLLFVI